MAGNIRSTNLRFNLDKPEHRQAWEYLQRMDKRFFKSYSHVIAVALVDYFDRYYRTQEDPYLETRHREEQFVNQIVAAVEVALEKALPVFLAGCMEGIVRATPMAASTQDTGPQEVPESDVDWDFLGE